MRRIGTIYFGIQERKQQKPQGGLMGMIQNMMSELGAGGMGDSDDDSDDNQSGNFFVVEARPSKFSQFKI